MNHKMTHNELIKLINILNEKGNKAMFIKDIELIKSLTEILQREISDDAIHSRESYNVVTLYCHRIKVLIDAIRDNMLDNVERK